MNPVPVDPIGDLEDPTNPFYVDCTAYEGQPFFSSSTLQGVICGFKKMSLSVAQTLFEPSEDTTSGYGNLTIRGKFPFEYWYDFQEAVESEVAQDAKFPSLQLTMPFRPSSTPFAVFSSTTITTYVTPTGISLFKSFIEISLWFGVGFFLYHKIKRTFDSP